VFVLYVYVINSSEETGEEGEIKGSGSGKGREREDEKE
jgi:hypothetical protein